jgi:hypothetical protein
MVFPVVSRARRRLLWNSIAAQSANALSVGMGTVICLLILGTDLIDWRWTVALPLVILAAGIYLVARQIPDWYATARIVDTRLKLADTLATALFFAVPLRAARSNPAICEAQRGMAASVAGNLDARSAVPMQMPRATYVAASLVILAGGLIALRYGIQGTLDLRAPMAGMVRQMLFRAKADSADLQEKLQRQMAASRPGSKNQSSRPDTASDRSTQADNPQAAGAERTDAQDKRKGGGNSNRDENASQGDHSQKDQESADAEQQAGEEQNGRGQQADSGQDGPEQRNGSGRPGRFDGESNSFGAKLSNAMQNLLSALSPRPSAGRQQMGSSRGAAQRSNQPGGNQNSGSKRDGQRQDQDAAQGKQTAEGGKPQDSPATGSGESAGAKGERRQASGAGRQDGDKTIKEAEQLEAMGKLSLLLGKRAENVTGDVALEVESGRQRLITQYVQKNATHTDVQARTNRDEVPLALEPYVERYFDQIRKHGAANGPRARRRESAPRH